MKNYILFLLLMLTAPAFGADWYVDNSISTGLNDGTDWENAWQSIADMGWDDVNPGDTIYFSGGASGQDYAKITPDTTGTIGNPITIRCSQESGKNGQVTFEALILGTYIVYNGAKDDDFVAPSSTVDMRQIISNIGISVSNPAESGTGVYGGSTTTLTGCKVLWVEVSYCGDPEGTGDGSDAGNGFWLNSIGMADDFEIGFCYIHHNLDGLNNNGGTYSSDWDNITIHHSVIDLNIDDGIQVGVGGVTVHHTIVGNKWTDYTSGHPDSLQQTFAQYGKFHAYNNILFNTWNAWVYNTLGAVEGGEVGDVYFYGNICYMEDDWIGRNAMNYGVHLGAWGSSGNVGTTTYANVYFCNNTIYGAMSETLNPFFRSFDKVTHRLFQMTLEDCVLKNNLVYDCGRPPWGSGVISIGGAPGGSPWEDTSTDLSFVDSNPDTIVRSEGSWVTDGVAVGDEFGIVGADGDDYDFLLTVDGVTATTITVSEDLVADTGDVAATLYQSGTFYNLSSDPSPGVIGDYNVAAISDAAYGNEGFGYAGVGYDDGEALALATDFKNNTSTEPTFEDLDNYDFRLASTDTAALDQGENLTPLISGKLTGLGTDLYGNPRGSGVAWDIGALERNDGSLILHLQFEDDLSDGTATDSSGEGNNGHQYGFEGEDTNWPSVTSVTLGETTSNAAVFELVIDGYGTYGRSGDYVAINEANESAISQATIMAWAKYDAVTGGYQAVNNAAIIDNGQYRHSGGGWALGHENFWTGAVNTRKTKFELWSGTAATDRIQCEFPDECELDGSTDQMNHYAVVFNNGTITTYFNGEFYETNESAQTTLNLWTTTRWSAIGAGPHHGSVTSDPYLSAEDKDPPGIPDDYDEYPNWRWFNGKIDNVRIYNAALTSSGVEAVYNSEGGITGNPPDPPGQHGSAFADRIIIGN